MKVEKIRVKKEFAKDFLTVYENYKKIFSVTQHVIATKCNMKNNTLTNCLRKLRQKLGIISGYRVNSNKFLKITYNKLLNIYNIMQAELNNKELKVLNTHTKTSLPPKVYTSNIKKKSEKEELHKTFEKKGKYTIINDICNLLGTAHFTYEEVDTLLNDVTEKYYVKAKAANITNKFKEINTAINLLGKHNDVNFAKRILKTTRHKLVLEVLKGKGDKGDKTHDESQVTC